MRHAHYPDLEGQVAVVTGCSSGIGAAVVDRLLDSGCRVAGVDLATPGRTASDVFMPLVADISDEPACASIAKEVENRWGEFALLVHSAGILGRPQPLADLDVDQFDRIIRINLRGTMLVLQMALRHLRDRASNGSIVCVSSIAATRTNRNLAAYSASKRGMMGLVAAAAQESAPRVRVNAVAPGIVDTPLIRGDKPAISGVALERSEATPLARAGKPGEIAAAVLWLLSDESSYVTGTTITVDGGSVG